MDKLLQVRPDTMTYLCGSKCFIQHICIVCNIHELFGYTICTLQYVRYKISFSRQLDEERYNSHN